MQTPRTFHMMALDHTLWYLTGTFGEGILLKAAGPLILKAFFDSDWPSCSFSRRYVNSLYGFAGHFPYQLEI